MKKLVGMLFAAAFAASVFGTAAGSAAAATLCVGTHSGCYTQLQPAVDAAHDGDTVRIEPGTYPGGVTVNVSVAVVGAGPESTTISGGGPVLMIGTFSGSSEPTVSIRGLTITGGNTTSAAVCGPTCGTGYVTATALGGGIEIAGSASARSVVSISDSVVTGNRAATDVTVPSVRATCPGGPCRFSTGGGGGIDSWGDLTLTNTTVAGNRSGGASSSDAYGGGILAEVGSVTLVNSRVTGNRAVVVPPNGRFAEGGAIFARTGVPLTISNSSIDGNVADLSSLLPFFLPNGKTIDMNANGGGVHAGDATAVQVEHSRIDGNTASANDPNGEPYAFDAGLFVPGGSLVLRNSSVSNNTVSVVAASSDDVGPSGNALEFDGTATVANTRITGNSATVTDDGGAAALGAVAAFGQTAPVVVSNSIVSGNTAVAFSRTGTATAQGGGIVNDGILDLQNDRIADNSTTAHGATGAAQGGGIWNDELFFGPPMQLTLENTVVTRNAVAADAGLSAEGGGIFTAFPLTLTHSVVARNTPDDCFGC